MMAAPVLPSLHDVLYNGDESTKTWVRSAPPSSRPLPPVENASPATFPPAPMAKASSGARRALNLAMLLVGVTLGVFTGNEKAAPRARVAVQDAVVVVQHLRAGGGPFAPGLGPTEAAAIERSSVAASALVGLAVATHAAAATRARGGSKARRTRYAPSP